MLATCPSTISPLCSVSFIVSSCIPDCFPVTHFISLCFRWPDNPARLKRSRAARRRSYLHSTMNLAAARKHVEADFYEEPVIVFIIARIRRLKERKDSALSSPTISTTHGPSPQRTAPSKNPLPASTSDIFRTLHRIRWTCSASNRILHLSSMA